MAESTGCVHSGFAVAVRALRPQILEWIECAKPETSKLILTGQAITVILPVGYK